MESKKRIIALVEKDKRFAHWSYEHWSQNMLWDKTSSSWISSTEAAERRPGLLAASQSGLPAFMLRDPGLTKICRQIHVLASKRKLMPLRRRDFEVAAMVRELMEQHRAGRDGRHGFKFKIGGRWSLPPALQSSGGVFGIRGKGVLCAGRMTFQIVFFESIYLCITEYKQSLLLRPCLCVFRSYRCHI